MPKHENLLSWKPLPYLVALLFTLFILVIHMLPNMDSMLNENNTEISHIFLKSQIDYHKEIAPFARRPFTTLLMDGTVEAFGLKSGYAFILVNFFFLFLSGVLVYRLSKNLVATSKQALANMVVYFSSFSILFAFFPPVFSFDEPLQYCCILMALIAFVRRKWVWYVLFFTLALITRETSMLLLPALVLFLPGIRTSIPKLLSFKRLQLSVWVLLPLLFYGIFIAVFIWEYELMEATQIEMASRYSCFLENFESNKNTMESMTSIFLALAPFLYFCSIYLKGKHRYESLKRFVSAFLVTVAINTPIVVLTAFARETRLFALPLFFIWPMFAQLFGQELKLLFSFGLYPQLFLKWRYLLVFLPLNFANYWFCFQIYRKSGLGENTFFSEYLFVMVFCLITHYLLHHFYKTSAINTQKGERAFAACNTANKDRLC